MTAKTQNCGKCVHFDPSWAAGVIKRVCLLKHKPRFFPLRAGLDNAWGWKRRCDDFKTLVEVKP